MIINDDSSLYADYNMCKDKRKKVNKIVNVQMIIHN